MRGEFLTEQLLIHVAIWCTTLEFSYETNHNWTTQENLFLQDKKCCKKKNDGYGQCKVCRIAGLNYNSGTGNAHNRSLGCFICLTICAFACGRLMNDHLCKKNASCFFFSVGALCS